MYQGDRDATLTHRLVSAANSDNATVAVDRGCRAMRVRGDNAAAAKRYIKLYDKATAPASTDTPKEVLVCAASAPFNFDLSGLTFIKGLGYRIVTGNADNDATAVTAADIQNLTIEIDR